MMSVYLLFPVVRVMHTMLMIKARLSHQNWLKMSSPMTAAMLV